MKSINHERKIYLVCLACVVVWVAMVGLWMSLDTRPPTWDAGYHIGRILDFSNALFRPFSLEEVSNVLSQQFPPLSYLILSPFGYLSSSETFLVSVANLIFGCILAGAAFGICRRLKMPSAAIGTVLLSLSFPSVGNIAKNFYLDFPLTSWVVLTLYFILLCRDEFSSRNCVVLGIILGLGMLSKWTFVGYILGPLFFLFVVHIKGQETGRGRAKIFLKFFIMLVIVCLMNIWWYFPQLEALKGHAQAIAFRIATTDVFPKTYTWRNILYYFSDLVGAEGAAIPFFFSLAGCVLLLKNKVRGAGFLILYSLGSYIFITLIPNKDMRFAIPLVPGLALTLFVGLASIKNMYLKKGLIAFIYLWCILQVAFQYFLPLPQLLKKAEISVAGISFKVFRDIGMHDLSAQPLNENWYLQEIIDQISNPVVARDDADGHSLVLLLVDQMYHNPNTLSYEAKRLRRKIDFVSVASPNLTEKERQEITGAAYDYIVYRPVSYEHYDYFRRFIDQLHQAFLVSGEGYTKIKTFLLPDGETLHIYKNNQRAQDGQNQNLP